MIKFFIALSLFFVMTSHHVIGQDLHYSQYFNSPMNISPGLTGVFNGEQRIAANFRQQWRNVPVDYRNFDLSYDFKYAPTDSTNYFNLGALFNYDNAGDLGLQHVGVNLLGSFMFRISDRLGLSPGIGIGFVQRRFDQGQVITGNQWDGRGFDPSIAAEVIGEDNLSFINISFGLNARYQKSDRTFLDLGLSAVNLNGPSTKFTALGDYDSNLARRFNIYGMGTFRLAKKLDLLLNAVYQTQSPHQEAVLNGQVKIYLDKNFSKALHLGVGMRLGDAWYPMIAIQYDNIYASFSYDYNTSGFDVATDGAGGPELAFKYIISRVPFYPVKPCPIY